jgi:hypothetical protein
VGAGKVDAHEVDIAVAHVKGSVEASHGMTADAMTTLHAALTAVERAALIDKIMAHWEVWRTSNNEEQDVGAEAHGRTCRLSRLTDEVGLSPEQSDKIRTELRATPLASPDVSSTALVDDVGACLQTFGHAFASDAFDAKSVASCNGADSHLAISGATHMARFFSVVAPVLTAGQRTTLAALLGEHFSNTGVAATAKRGTP